MTQRLDQLDTFALHPADRWRRTKQAIRSAAASTRNAALAARPKSGLARAQRAIQLARAIHRHDGKAVAGLLRRWPELRDIITAQRGDITVNDGARLQRLISDAIQAFSTQLNDADTSPGKASGRTPHRHAQIAAWLRLRVPHMRRRWLAGVTPPHDATADHNNATTDPADALATHWRAAFQPAVTNRRLGRALARTFIFADPDDMWPLPTSRSIGKALRRA